MLMAFSPLFTQASACHDVAHCALSLGHIHKRIADYEETSQFLVDVYDLLFEAGDARSMAICRLSLDEVLFDQEQIAEAKAPRRQVRDLYLELGDKGAALECLGDLIGGSEPRWRDAFATMRLCSVHD